MRAIDRHCTLLVIADHSFPLLVPRGAAQWSLSFDTAALLRILLHKGVPEVAGFVYALDFDPGSTPLKSLSHSHINLYHGTVCRHLQRAVNSVY